MDTITGLRKVTLSFTSLIVLVCGLVFAGEDFQPQPIGPFSGVNNRDSSFAIPAQNSQDCLNVNITPGGKSVFKRKGYGLAFTLPITTSPVHGIYTFFDSNGNTVDLFANDTYLSGSVGAASPTVIFSTGPNGATYQCTDTLGFAYCANSQRTTLIKTNGVTYSQISNVASTGTMVATCVTRLAMAGFSDRPSAIDFSQDSDFTTWGTGSLGTSPVQLTVSAPGSKITGIVYAFSRLMWFKDSSFGFVLIGNQSAQTDWVIKTVSYDVGTNDNSFVFREGILYFRGQDGHIYTFDGSTYQRLSREISGTIATEQNRTQNSWLQSSQADFQSGSLTNLDAVSNPGSLRLSLLPSTTFQSYAPGNSVGQKINNGTARQFSTTSYFLLNAVILPVITSGNPASVLSFSIRTDASGLPGTTILSQNISTNTYVAVGNGNLQITLTSSLAIQGGTTYWIYLQGAYTDGSNKLNWWDTTNTNFPYKQLVDGSTITTTAKLQYYLIGSTYITNGTYLSAVKNAPQLKTWDFFSANYQDNDGSNSFSIRSSTNPIDVTSSTPSWTSIISGNIPIISTGTYFQFRDIFTTNYSTETPILNNFTQNWFEGQASDKAYATYFDDKIWFEVTAGTGSTTNNKTLVYDMLNQTWVLYDLAMNGFLVRQNKLYLGSASNGYIYKFGDVDNDNGNAINAYWKSKDFFGNSPFSVQELANISIVAKEVDTSSMTVTYSINGSSDVAYVVPLYQANSIFMNKNKNIQAGTIAGDFNVKFGNDAADQPFEVYGVQVGIRPKTWIPN